MSSDPFTMFAFTLWLIHIAGLGFGFGLGFKTRWVHCTMQNFSHWFGSGSRSLFGWFPEWLLYPF